MTRRLHEQIVEIIGGMIESGDLSGGDRLPPERKLADTYQVSRNTVREAIKTLTEKKILYSIVGSGTYVAEAARDILRTSIDEALEQKKHRISDIFELRRILEPQIAALAAQRVGPDDITALAETLSMQEKALGRNESTREWDERFHRLLARATDNTVLLHVYEKLQDLFFESRADDLQNPERKKVSLALHRAIFEAVRDGEPDKAARKMNRHMTRIQKTMDRGKGKKQGVRKDRS